MTALERAELESRADRCVRRGELGEALAIFQTLTAEFPGEPGLQAKLATVQESLQPAELLNPKANFRREPEPEDISATPEQEGERLFALGDYAGAAAAYRRALEQKPDSELIRERLEELYRLARASAPRAAPAPLARTGPVAWDARAERTPSAAPTTSAAWDTPAARVAAPAARPEELLPPDPAQLLESLLERISSRRRA